MKMLPPNSQYPKKIYISSEVYRVKFVKGLDKFGDSDPAKKLIRIKDGMSRRETFMTFIHEILHALTFEHDFDLKHKQVYALEKSLFELWADNFL